MKRVSVRKKHRSLSPKLADRSTNMPKLLSVFYNDQNRLKHVTYVLDANDQRQLADVIAELLKCFEIDQDADNDRFTFELYDFNHRKVRKKRLLYADPASTFYLRKSVRINDKQSVKSELRQESIAPFNLPQIKQLRPSITTKISTGIPTIADVPLNDWMLGLSSLELRREEKISDAKSIAEIASITADNGLKYVGNIGQTKLVGDPTISASIPIDKTAPAITSDNPIRSIIGDKSIGSGYGETQNSPEFRNPTGSIDQKKRDNSRQSEQITSNRLEPGVGPLAPNMFLGRYGQEYPTQAKKDTSTNVLFGYEQIPGRKFVRKGSVPLSSWYIPN